MGHCCLCFSFYTQYLLCYIFQMNVVRITTCKLLGKWKVQDAIGMVEHTRIYLTSISHEVLWATHSKDLNSFVSQESVISAVWLYHSGCIYNHLSQDNSQELRLELHAHSLSYLPLQQFPLNKRQIQVCYSLPLCDSCIDKFRFWDAQRSLNCLHYCIAQENFWIFLL